MEWGGESRVEGSVAAVEGSWGLDEADGVSTEYELGFEDCISKEDQCSDGDMHRVSSDGLFEFGEVDWLFKI